MNRLHHNISSVTQNYDMCILGKSLEVALKSRLITFHRDLHYPIECINIWTFIHFESGREAEYQQRQYQDFENQFYLMKLDVITPLQYDAKGNFLNFGKLLAGKSP